MERNTKEDTVMLKDEVARMKNEQKEHCKIRVERNDEHP